MTKARRGRKKAFSARILVPALLVTMGVGLALRFWGLGFGLPLDLRPDERYYRVVALQMVQSGDPNPHFFAYPGLPFHALVAMMKVLHVGAGLLGLDGGGLSFQEFIGDPEITTRAQRVVAALAGVASIPLIFLVGASAGCRRVGLWAAILLATSHLHVRHSHFGVVDSLTLFCVILALWAILRAERSGNAASFVAAGALSGLATATRYTPALLALPIAVAAIGAGRREGSGWFASLRHRRLWLAAAAMIVVFLLGAPYTLLAWDEFRAAFPGQTDVALGWYGLGPLIEQLTVSLRYGLGLPLLALALVGLAGAVHKRRTDLGPLIVFGAANLVLLLLSSASFARYALPLVPVCVVLAAEGIELVSGFMATRLRRALVAAALLAVAVAPSLHRSVASNVLLGRDSSLYQLRQWLQAELPPGARLAFANPVVAENVFPTMAKVPYDPLRILYGGDPTYVVKMSHPLDYVEPTDGVDSLLAHSTAEPLFEVQALDERAAHSAVFDQSDAFFYPLGRFAGVQRGGPDVAVYRVAPSRPADELPPRPGSPVNVSLEPFDRGVAVSWEPPADGTALGYYLRFVTVEEYQANRVPAPMALPPGLTTYGQRSLAPGRWLVAVSAVGVGGEGKPAIGGPIDVATDQR